MAVQDPSAAVSEAKPTLGIVRYFANLSVGRYVLWCYFIYWLVIAVHYFDPRPRIWITSLGLSGIIGLALFINTTRSGATRVTLGFWPGFRLFLTPFCVSSFAALVKDKHFALIFATDWNDALMDVSIATVICVNLAAAKWIASKLA